MMDRIRLNEETGIPLFLIPEKIKGKIKKMGDRIYRISVKRTEHHHYSVSVRTKTLPRELMPGQVPHIPSVPPADCRKGACMKGVAPS
jgi:hypothetical protein